VSSEFDNLSKFSDSVKAIICKLEPDGRISKINRYGLSLLGLKEEEVVGRSAFGLIFPLNREAEGCPTPCSLKALVSSGGNMSVTCEIKRRGGTPAMVSWLIFARQYEIIAIGLVGDQVTVEKRTSMLEEKSRAILKLTSLLMRPDTDIGDVAEAVLEEAKRLTGSLYGFVGTIDQETGELVGHTLTRIPGCAVTAAGARFAPGSDGKYRSLFGHALNTRTPFYTNSPRDHPASRGTPPGHVRIDQFLAVPVLLEANGRPLGLIALANPKKGAYDANDLEAVCHLSYYFALSLNRRFLEERIKRSEEYYRKLFEGIPLPVYLVNREGLIERVNGAITRLLGYSREELEGKHWEDLVHPKVLEKMREYRRMRLSGEGQPPTSYETVLLRKDGNPVECQLNIVYVEGGRILGALFDLTDIKRTQHELEKSKKELERYATSLEKMVEEKTRELLEKERLATIGEVTLMVGHDLRNPLQAVTNLSFLLKMMVEEGRKAARNGRGANDSDAELVTLSAVKLLNIADSLSRSVKYMNKIVSDLQDYARPLSPEFVSAKLKAAIDGALFGIELPKNIILKVSVGHSGAPAEGAIGEGPDVGLLLPLQLLQRALKNLITNAIQAMPNGGTLEVSAWIEKDTAQMSTAQPHTHPTPNTALVLTPAPTLHPYSHPQLQHQTQPQSHPQLQETPTLAPNMVAVFSVSDTGKGIPPEMMDNLFKPFKTTKSKGTGLGLAIVKRIVNTLGGTVEVESDLGKGTKFRIKVPVRYAQ
jgi:PAS domain S-box-containing protein